MQVRACVPDKAACTGDEAIAYGACKLTGDDLNATETQKVSATSCTDCQNMKQGKWCIKGEIKNILVIMWERNNVVGSGLVMR